MGHLHVWNRYYMPKCIRCDWSAGVQEITLGEFRSWCSEKLSVWMLSISLHCLCSEQQTWHPKNLELSQRGQVRNDVAFGHLFFWALRAVESSPQANGMNFAIPNLTDSGAEVNCLQMFTTYVYIVSDLIYTWGTHLIPISDCIYMGLFWGII